jgi:hypothetical protein
VESEVVDGDKLTKNSYSVDGDLLNDLYVQTSTQEYCDQKGGSVEAITVPAGSFETCRVSVGGQVAWYSDLVPFGQVQVVTLDDNGKETSKQVLTGFALGK